MPTHHDAGDWGLFVNGKLISEAEGLSGFSPDRSPTPIMTPGRVRVGVNRQRSANGADFSFRVKRTSTDLEYLYDLVDQQLEIPVKSMVIKNLDSYAVDQEIEIGCQFGTLGGGGRGGGDAEEAETIEFSVTGRGQIRKYKT